MIVFKPEAMLRYNIGLSLNAIVVTSCNIPWTTFELIYVIPPVHSGDQWVLYTPDLIGRFRDTLFLQLTMSILLWPNRRCLRTLLTMIVVGGNVPTVRKAVNPKGFTSCLNCRVRVTFEPIK